MHTLYYAPGACSLSPHIVLREAGLEFDLQKVSTKTKEMEGGGDFRTINPLGYVAKPMAVDLGSLSNLRAFRERMAERLSVKAVLAAEGLSK